MDRVGRLGLRILRAAGCRTSGLRHVGRRTARQRRRPGLQRFESLPDQLCRGASAAFRPVADSGPHHRRPARSHGDGDGPGRRPFLGDARRTGRRADSAGDPPPEGRGGRHAPLAARRMDSAAASRSDLSQRAIGMNGWFVAGDASGRGFVRPYGFGQPLLRAGPALPGIRRQGLRRMAPGPLRFSTRYDGPRAGGGGISVAGVRGASALAAAGTLSDGRLRRLERGMARGAAVRTGFGPVLAEAVPLGAFLHGRCAGRNRCGALTCCGSRDFAYLCPIQPNTLVPMYDVEFFADPSAADLDALTDLWETSVRATHDFLAPDEICFYRSLVRGGALSAVRLWVVRRPGGDFAAFAGRCGRDAQILFSSRPTCGAGGWGGVSWNMPSPAAACGVSMSMRRIRRPRASMRGSDSASCRAIRSMRRDGRIRFSTSLCECAAVLRPPDGRCGRTGRSKNDFRRSVRRHSVRSGITPCIPSRSRGVATAP